MSVKDPKRRVIVTLELGADTIDEAVWALREIATDAERTGLRDVVSGGYATGWLLKVTEDPNVTHESWEVDLEAWLADQRGTPDAPPLASGSEGRQEDAPELDSPDFRPAQLNEFEARGYDRRNRDGRQEGE